MPLPALQMRSAVSGKLSVLSRRLSVILENLSAMLSRHSLRLPDELSSQLIRINSFILLK